MHNRSCASSFSAGVLVAWACLLRSAAMADDPWIVYEGKEGQGQGKHIVLVAGDEERGPESPENCSNDQQEPSGLRNQRNATLQTPAAADRHQREYPQVKRLGQPDPGCTAGSRHALIVR